MRCSQGHPPYARSSTPRLGDGRGSATLRFLQVRRKAADPSSGIRFWWIPMELQTHGARKYPTSALLRSSAGLGWSTISAELRAHGVSETPVVVPQHVELCHAVAGNNNGLVRRSGAGQCQEFVPTTGAICLAPVGVGDNTTAITAPIPETMHLYLPKTLFRRLSDDFNLPGAPAHSIRYVAGIQDELINQIILSILSEITNETAAGRMYVEAASLTLADRVIHNTSISSRDRHDAGGISTPPALLVGRDFVGQIMILQPGAGFQCARSGGPR